MDFVVRCYGKKHIYKLSDVVRLEARSNYTIVYSIDRKPILVAKVLSAYERLLRTSNFVRVHRSHLINRGYINYVDEKGNLVLRDRSIIELPRRKKKALIEQLNSEA